MLEIQDLKKVYKPKRGVAVNAVNGISLKFPETGMIIILGKSGSGKSTLLNLLGGLDKYDSGDILFNGESTKEFSQSKFDSYRNTYVGFIFQEYNILDEFSVGANIALAIELQNRKASNEEINKILCDVDLEGYGQRKPNELSGGQKQRVAIARALVKNPDIIMADEPSGALDSETGKQVFDTLKKLSENKLVIIVSHDREFAEKYADRIIELSDGKVISDVEASYDESESASKIVTDGENIVIKSGYRLSEADRTAINEFLMSGDRSLLDKRNTQRNISSFTETDQSKITEKKKGFTLIKSKLPFPAAFRMGASALKYKKVRLAFTLLLSLIAFTMFGISDTAASFNVINAGTESLYDSEINELNMRAKKKYVYGEGEEDYYYRYANMDEKSLALLSEKTGVEFRGVYSDADFSISDNIQTDSFNYSKYIYEFGGLIEIDDGFISDMGFKLKAGNLPNDFNEIAISDFVYSMFKEYGFVSKDDGISGTKIEIKDYSDLIGKKLSVFNEQYVISGIIDTGIDLSRYASLFNEKQNDGEIDIRYYMLMAEYEAVVKDGTSSLMFVKEGFLDKKISSVTSVVNHGNMNFNDNYILSSFRLGDAKSDIGIIPFDGEITSLGSNKVLMYVEDYMWMLSNFCRKDEEYSKITVSEADAEKYMEKYPNETMPLYDYITKLFVDHSLGGLTDSELINAVKKYIPLSFSDFSLKYSAYYTDEDTTLDVSLVGLFYSKNDTVYSSTLILPDAIVDLYDNKDGIYSFGICVMPSQKQVIKDIVKFSYTETDGCMFIINNAVMMNLDSANDFIMGIAKVFVYIGLGFAIFAALLLSTFIASSVSYKKREIGILRALGSRSNDVFRIFFSESFIIAIANFVDSLIVSIAGCIALNYSIRAAWGLSISLMNFGLRQVVLLLAISLFVAFMASFLPVMKIASKKPIDAIREK